MATKFANILGFLGLGSDKEAVTEAHLEAADSKIAQLEQAKADAEGKLSTVEADLKTAQEAKTKLTGDLTAAEEKVTTLEKWKQEQKATDPREEDESNKLDDQPEAKESWEVAATAAVASAKKRVGQK